MEHNTRVRRVKEVITVLTRFTCHATGKIEVGNSAILRYCFAVQDIVIQLSR